MVFQLEIITEQKGIGNMKTNENGCINFECENIKDYGCVYEDKDIMCDCNLCELVLDCDRCKHKTNCNKITD